VFQSEWVKLVFQVHGPLKSIQQDKSARGRLIFPHYHYHTDIYVQFGPKITSKLLGGVATLSMLKKKNAPSASVEWKFASEGQVCYELEAAGTAESLKGASAPKMITSVLTIFCC